MTEPTDAGPSLADQLFRLIRSFGYTTHGQTAEIVDAIVAKWGAPPQISGFTVPQADSQPAPTYKDSTPELHDGDSAFESWYSTYNPAHKSDKQRARDAYAAGMGDPLVMAAPAAVAGQCEDAIELLGKYKELCEEIKRGDSYHIGRIDAAISVLAQAAPQPAVQQGDADVEGAIKSAFFRFFGAGAERDWHTEPGGWFIEGYRAANPAAPVAQGDARAEQALLKVLAAVQRYLPPDGPSAKDTLAEIIGIIDPWPLGDQKGKA